MCRLAVPVGFLLGGGGADFHVFFPDQDGVLRVVLDSEIDFCYRSVGFVIEERKGTVRVESNAGSETESRNPLK